VSDSLDQYYRSLGVRLRVARIDAGLTQNHVAQATGLTRASVANMESGRQKILVHHLVTLAAALDTEISSLLPDSAPVPLRVDKLPEDQGVFLRAVLASAGNVHG
jgi:transcriptional regulator with XRE-family HTH domain